LSKYAELQRTKNTPYYTPSWGWVAWDYHGCAKGSLEGLEKRILNFGTSFHHTLGKELKKISEDSASPVVGRGVTSCCSLVHPCASWSSR